MNKIIIIVFFYTFCFLGNLFSSQENLTQDDWAKLKKGEVVFKGEIWDDEQGKNYLKGKAMIIIDKPPIDVWNQITDYDNIWEFYPNLKYSKLIKSEGNTNWCQYHLSAMLGLVNISYVLKLAQIEKPRIINLELDKSYPHDIEESIGGWILETIDEGGETLVIYSLYVNTGVQIPMFLQKYMTNRQMSEVLGNVKKRVESGGEWKK